MRWATEGLEDGVEVRERQKIASTGIGWDEAGRCERDYKGIQKRSEGKAPRGKE